MFRLPLIAIVCLFAQLTFGAAPTSLKRASIEEISGEVTVKKETDTADRKAYLRETISGKDIIRTGKKSRAELEFEDQSICRLGANTIFSFDPQTRDMAFSRGVALVHVPPGKGGARIATPAATAAIQGDTIVLRATTMPDGTPATQFTALSPKGGPTDGNIMITLNNNPNASFRLEGGQLAIVPANATSLSQIPRAEIDVGTFAAKSTLLQDLPASAGQEVGIVSGTQSAMFDSGIAQRTEYAIVGDYVVKADADGNFTAPTTTEASSSQDTTSPSTTQVTTTDPSTYSGETTATTEFFSPEGAMGTFSTLQTVSTALSEVTGTISPTTSTPLILNPVSLSISTVFNTTLGTITGTGLNLQQGVDFLFTQSAGAGEFTFNTLSLSAPIDVQGGNGLMLTVLNTSGAANSLSISGVAFTFSAAPKSVDIAANSGNVNISGAVTAPGDVTIAASNGDLTMAAGSSINTSSAGAGVSRDVYLEGKTVTTQGISTIGATGGDGGDVTLDSPHAGGSIVVNGNITMTGGNSSTANAGNGGNLYATADTVTASGNIQANGGSTTFAGGNGGTGGMIDLASYDTVSASGLLTSNGGGATTGIAGDGGSVFVLGDTITSSSTIQSTGGAATGAGGTGGYGGGIAVQSFTAGSTLSVSGTMTANGGGSTTGTAGNGGSINVFADATTFSGSTTVTANGGAASSSGIAGDGGTAVIGSSAAALNTTGNTVTLSANGANSASGPAGFGGIAALSGTSVTVANGSTLSAIGGNVTSAGPNNGGDGGYISIDATAGAILMGTSSGSTINTSGGSTTAGGVGGYGGYTDLTATTGITAGTSSTGTAPIINAVGGNAPGGTGGLGGEIHLAVTGGNIALTSAATADTALLSAAGGTAAGGTGGAGGVIDLAATTTIVVTDVNTTGVATLNAPGGVGSANGAAGTITATPAPTYNTADHNP